MIKKETKNGITHFYSDKGKKIQRKDAKFPVNNAYEKASE